MIIDAFSFFNELDLLEIRLNELYPIVDKFILIESVRTHSNKEKELFFENNKQRYSKFLDKIDHIVVNVEKVDSIYKKDNKYCIDWYQKDYPLDYLRDYSDDSILIFTDVDEIIKKESISEFDPNLGIMSLYLSNRYFFMNMVLNTKGESQPWKKSKISTLGYIRSSGKKLHELRDLIINPILSSGWHFGWLGGIDKIIYKIESFSHIEGDKEELKDKVKLEKLISEIKDPFNRGFEYKIVSITRNYPNYVLENLDYYKSIKYFYLETEKSKNDK